MLTGTIDHVSKEGEVSKTEGVSQMTEKSVQAVRARFNVVLMKLIHPLAVTRLEKPENSMLKLDELKGNLQQFVENSRGRIHF